MSSYINDGLELWLENIAILNVKGSGYRCIVWNVPKKINRLNNFKLDAKGSLWIWILVKIKHHFK